MNYYHHYHFDLIFYGLWHGRASRDGVKYNRAFRGETSKFGNDGGVENVSSIMAMMMG